MLSNMEAMKSEKSYCKLLFSTLCVIRVMIDAWDVFCPVNDLSIQLRTGNGYQTFTHINNYNIWLVLWRNRHGALINNKMTCFILGGQKSSLWKVTFLRHEYIKSHRTLLHLETEKRRMVSIQIRIRWRVKGGRASVWGSSSVLAPCQPCLFPDRLCSKS